MNWKPAFRHFSGYDWNKIKSERVSVGVWINSELVSILNLRLKIRVRVAFWFKIDFGHGSKLIAIQIWILIFQISLSLTKMGTSPPSVGRRPILLLCQ